MEFFNRIIALAFIIGPLLLMSACGYTRAERMGSGATVGAVTGGVVGFMCCGDPIDGAGIGVVGGAIVGGVVGALIPGPWFFDYHDGQEEPQPSTDSQPQPVVIAPQVQQRLAPAEQNTAYQDDAYRYQQMAPAAAPWGYQPIAPAQAYTYPQQ